MKFTYSINSQDDTSIATSQSETDEDDLTGDIGQFVKLPNGDDFETGEMAAPHLGGAITPYEEVWRQLHPSMDVKDPFLTGAKAWILESVCHDSTTGSKVSGLSKIAHKTLLARVGPFFIAIQRRETKKSGSGEDDSALAYGAIREDFNATNGLWATRYAVGDHSGLWTMSAGKTFRGRSSEASNLVQVGDKLELDDRDELEHYIVRAVSY